jgi:hypothetical protein
MKISMFINFVDLDLVSLGLTKICTWVNVFRFFEGHQGRFRESCKSVEKIFEGGEVHFFVKKISSSSFLNLKKNNITI